MSLALQARDEESAEQIEQIIDQMLTMGGQMHQAQMAEQATSDDPVQQAMAQYVRRINKQLVKAVRPVRKGDRLVLSGGTQGQMQVAAIGILVALLLPAVQAARAAAGRMQSINNLKQIGLCLHNYHEKYGHLPVTTNFDDKDKPLVSWRVHILPYLEQEALYRQFKLDEPWDSEHNRKLIPLMPQTW